MTQFTETVSQLTRPIIGIENRTPLEVFDIMCDRIETARDSTNKDETIAKLVEALAALASDAGEFADAAEGHLSDSDFELDHCLSKSHASLTVTTLPNARAALTSTNKEG